MQALLLLLLQDGLCTAADADASGNVELVTGWSAAAQRV